MAKRKKKGPKKKNLRGLGCGPGPVSGDCAYDRPLAGLRGLRSLRSARPVTVVLGRGVARGLYGSPGLRGTPTEHARRAAGLLRRAQDAQASDNWKTLDCAERVSKSLSVLHLASRAEAEAEWVPGPKGKSLEREAAQLSTLAWSNIKSNSCGKR